ncbi:PP2C family serine/threonine-protein phosphatase [Butyrivibrio sp. AE3004]|uniref:PP2C family serine/threonine-protein phosphatase n=1 Tax=Butyrivibrio sp. AE3004 TaxID=1506994 RepID=UPI000494A43F|nr:PP2C family serine/threonine-protein phosphatase [Butyrivibrio sp. AE3004]
MRVVKVNASAMGASHKRSKNPKCQDANLVKTLPDHTIVACIADGHGSEKCRFSDRGARFAVEAFYELVRKYYSNADGNHDSMMQHLKKSETTKFVQLFHTIWKRKIKNSYDQIRKAYTDLSQIKEVNPELYGTTFIGMIIASDFVYGLQIGDGDMAFVDKRGYQVVIRPDKFLGVETYSMSEDEPWRHAKSYLQEVEFDSNIPFMYILTTDGFANSFKDDEQYQISCVDYFNTICKYGQKAVQTNLEEWLSQTSEEGCGDDITLVAVGGIEDEDDNETDDEGDVSATDNGDDADI